jgi:hypothetical protein
MTIYTPEELHAEVEARAGELGSVAFVAEGRYKRLREMWCASRFCMGYEKHFEPCSLEIGAEDEQREFDFHLIAEDVRLPFQIAEVMESDRRRCDEYRGKTQEHVDAIVNLRPSHSAAYAARRVADVLSTKKAKRYAASESLHVLLYLNLNVTSIPWATLASAAEPHAKAFASVWVESQHLFCCLYGGNRWSGAIGWKPIEFSS